MVNNTKNITDQLTKTKKLGEKILKSVELCKKLEFEHEKILKFSDD